MSESQHQVALFRWMESQREHPELTLAFHIPNGGARSRRTGAQLKREGVKRGVSDIMLPVARGNYHGLFLELKDFDGRPSLEQLAFLGLVEKQGYQTAICYGWEHARDTILAYLNGRELPHPPLQQRRSVTPKRTATTPKTDYDLPF